MNQRKLKIVKDSCLQYTNIVSIDPSTTCTGLCVNGELYNIVNYDIAVTKKDKFKRWFDISSPYCEIITYPAREKQSNYYQEELSKLEYYSNIKNIILCMITERITQSQNPENTLVLIEGFSYSSAAGHLIDLVTLSTLIRNAIVEKGFDLRVVAPSDLKLSTAKMSYDAVDVGKKKPKLEWRNTKGVSGGSFTKHDMLDAIMDSKHTSSIWKDFLAEYHSEISDMKSIPKPIEDVNDAFLLYKISQNGFLSV